MGSKITSKKYINLYAIYIFLYYYNSILNFLTFRPLMVNIYERFEIPEMNIYYFPNSQGAYLWNYIPENSQKLLIFVNSFYGNCSSRVNIMKRLLSYVNDTNLCILQIENPGCLISEEIDANILNVFTYTLDSINSFITHHQQFQDNYSIFTEEESSIIISKILTNLKIKPKQIIHFNPINSLTSNLIYKYGILISFFILPYFTHSSLLTNYKKYFEDKKFSTNTEILIICNEEYPSFSEDIYLDIEIPSERKKLYSIKGKGLSSLITYENEKIVTDVFRKIL